MRNVAESLCGWVGHSSTAVFRVNPRSSAANQYLMYAGFEYAVHLQQAESGSSFGNAPLYRLLRFVR